jgi:hypothetical protein
MYLEKMIESSGGVAVGIPENIQDARDKIQFGVGINHCDPVPGSVLMNKSVLKNKWYKKYPNMRPNTGE